VSGLSEIWQAAPSGISAGTGMSRSPGTAASSAQLPGQRNATRVPFANGPVGPSRTIPTPSSPATCGTLGRIRYCPRMKERSAGWTGRAVTLTNCSPLRNCGAVTSASFRTCSGSPGRSKAMALIRVSVKWAPLRWAPLRFPPIAPQCPPMLYGIGSDRGARVRSHPGGSAASQGNSSRPGHSRRMLS
jgi:hypothetical protein